MVPNSRVSCCRPPFRVSLGTRIVTHDQQLPDVDPGGALAEQRLVPCLFHHGLLTWGCGKNAAARGSKGQAEIWSAGSKRQYTALMEAPSVQTY